MSNHEQDLILLQNESLKVEVRPSVGASIYSFKYNLDGEWVNIMRPTPASALKDNESGSFSSYNLIPYSNRIEKGVFLYGAQTYQLAIDQNDGHALHGEVKDRAWKVINHKDNSVELEFDSKEYSDISWPFPFSAKIKYELQDNNFKIVMAVTNQSDQDMPAGMGIHPFFARKLTESDNKLMVNFPTKGLYPGETTIPTGTWEPPTPQYDFSTTRELKTDFIDKCYRAYHRPVKINWVNSGVELTMSWDEVYQHLVLYVPKDDFTTFAVEPVTNCNNAFNLANQGVEDTGTVYLAPDEELSGGITIAVARV